MNKSLEFHPLANIFPLLESDALFDLAEDIRKNGLATPIVLYEGKILDGRNRYRACAHMGVDPNFQEFKGKDPVSFVISLNLHRRHLDESQRAMVAEKLANLERGGDKPSESDSNFDSANLQNRKISQTQAAKLVNVGTRSVSAAKKVRSQGAPGLSEAVERGEVSVSAASDIADLPQEEQEEIINQGSAEIKRAAAEIRTKKASDSAHAHANATKALMKWKEKYLFLGFEDLSEIVQEVFKGEGL